MAAINRSSTSSSPSSLTTTNHQSLPPLVTSPPNRNFNLQRPPSHASKSRLSQYSNHSGPSRSRPPSNVYPVFHTSLPYALVRDFAYTTLHPLHYGPPLDSSRPASGLSTPVSEVHRGHADPPMTWEGQSAWGSSVSGEESRSQENLPPIQFGDGPPYSEDEDLQSPIVVTSRHKKHKSSGGSFASQNHDRGRPRDFGQERAHRDLLSPENYEQDRGYYAGQNGGGSARYHVSQGDEADGPGGEFVTYPADQDRHGGRRQTGSRQRDSHFAGTLLPSRSYEERHLQDHQSGSEASSRASSPGTREHDESRYSRDYQFSIASPDEEMHGKAVALFDFERENENELPLVEGQVIWVSYRHGQGWLVAEDPKTRENGLVPEEYVRLLRDIQGGLHSLTGQIDGMFSPGAEVGTPTQAEHSAGFGHAASASNGSNGYQQPVVSTFSTSSKDLQPYPQHLLGAQGQPPPQVVHYHGQRGGSQANTPTLASSHEGGLSRQESQGGDGKDRGITTVTSPVSVTSEESDDEGGEGAEAEAEEDDADDDDDEDEDEDEDDGVH